MKNIALKRAAAFTLTELLLVVAVLGILAALLLSSISTAKAKANRIKCQKHQKAIGTSFRVFALDNGGRYPLEVIQVQTNSYIVPGGATSSQVDATNAAAWQVGQAMWNEVQSPRALLCPSDRARQTFSRVIDFNGLAGVPMVSANPMTKTSLGHPDNQDKALSYAFGVAADESRPLGVLIVDRNVNNVGLAGAIISTNVAFTRTRVLLNDKAGPTQAVWIMGTRIHDLEGNLAYADGSVQQATATVLQMSLVNAVTAYGERTPSTGSGAVVHQKEILFP